MKNGSQTGQQTGQLARTCYSPQKLSDEEGLFATQILDEQKGKPYFPWRLP